MGGAFGRWLDWILTGAVAPLVESCTGLEPLLKAWPLHVGRATLVTLRPEDLAETCVLCGEPAVDVDVAVAGSMLAGFTSREDLLERLGVLGAGAGDGGA